MNEDKKILELPISNTVIENNSWYPVVIAGKTYRISHSKLKLLFQDESSLPEGSIGEILIINELGQPEFVPSDTVFSAYKLPSSWAENVAAIKAVIDYEEGSDIGDYSTSKVYQFDSTSMLDNNDTTVIKPDNIDQSSPGRWLFKADFNFATRKYVDDKFPISYLDLEDKPEISNHNRQHPVGSTQDHSGNPSLNGRLVIFDANGLPTGDGGLPSELSNTNHNHDDRYNTRIEITNLLSNKSPLNHTHTEYSTINHAHSESIAMSLFDAIQLVEITETTSFVVPSRLNGRYVKDVICSIFTKCATGAVNEMIYKIKKVKASDDSVVEMFSGTLNCYNSRSKVDTITPLTSSQQINTGDIIQVSITQLPTNGIRGFFITIDLDNTN